MAMEGVPSSLHPLGQGHRHHFLADVEQRPAIFHAWERLRDQRAQWVVECTAEMVNLPRPSSVLISSDGP